MLNAKFPLLSISAQGKYSVMVCIASFQGLEDGGGGVDHRIANLQVVGSGDFLE